jgi:hypothetical protein
MEVGGHHNTPTDLPPGKEIWYPLCRGLGQSRGFSGGVCKISSQTGFEHRTLQPVASSLFPTRRPINVEGGVLSQISPLTIFGEQSGNIEEVYLPSTVSVSIIPPALPCKYYIYLPPTIQNF